MGCQETQSLLHPYVDGELDLVRNLEIERHLQECTACAKAHRALQGLRTAIKGTDLYFEPPPGLARRVQPAARDDGRRRLSAPRLRWQPLAIAASLFLAALAGWSLARSFAPRATEPTLPDELLANHVRSQMLPGHRVDVESSDMHTVKPWFEGKLDFSPKVTDLADHGFPLIGGRLDYVNHRPVAALVYQRRQHLINVFVWPSEEAPTTPQLFVRQGYHMLHWTQAGMTYWAVSDLNEAELNDFARQIEEKAQSSRSAP